MANTVFYDATQSAGASLVVFGKDGIFKTYMLNAPVLQIGRLSSNCTCDIALDSRIVSRTHGEICQVNGKYYYRDLGSTNGTYVNRTYLGNKAPDGKVSTPLNDGDVISFDIYTAAGHHPERVFALFTLCDCSDYTWRTVDLDPSIAEICVGRSEESGFMVDNEMFSERHASFFAAKGGWAIIDHQSTNGVFLNGERLGEPKYITEYDTIRIVDTYFLFMGNQLIVSETGKPITQNLDKPASKPANKPASKPANKPETAAQKPVAETKPATAPQRPQLVINIVERSVVQRFKKMMLLQDINLSIANGEMVLILGGSGAGKTTFINAVMGYEKAAGKIEYKNTNIYDEYEQMKYEIGFVPQQDLLRNSDTVLDTLSNAADMKLPSRTSPQEKTKRINEVLEELGLTREKKSLVSKLSGGQKKRLSIAVEFISNPSLFFLDEPDSGLDGIMGRGLMENLRKISDRGTIIMIITHAPDRAADLFDKVIVLAKSTKDNCGHLAFFGSVNEAYDFFEVDSLERIVKRINRPDENGEGLSDHYIEKYETYKENK